MKNRISIDLFRVSSDSKYIDMIFDCPSGEQFYMSAFKLEVRDGNGNSENFDLTPALFTGDSKEDQLDKDHWVVRIPLDKLGITYPAIYIAELKAHTWPPENPEEEDDYEPIEVTSTAICSDVNNVYRCLLDSVIESCDECSSGCKMPDDAIRNYLILYGHQAAMYQRDLDVAERYFRILSRCFTNCGERREPKSIKPAGCGCGCGK